MPTLLTTPKMSPALAARVQASVSGSGKGRGVRLPRGRALLRLVVVAAILLLGGSLWWSVRQTGFELAAAQSKLRARVAQETSARPRHHAALLPLVLRLVVDAATHAEQAPLQTSPQALRALLARPSLYVRGRASDLTVAAQVSLEAAETRRDALLACLVAPPASDEAAVLLERVKAVYRGTAFREAPLTQTHLLHELVATSVYLGPEFEQRIQAAHHLEQVAQLTQAFERAELPRLREAAHAEVLIYALDEPKTAGTIVELDGASDRFVRIGIVDLTTATTLVRARLHALPSRFPLESQARYLQGLTDCQLGFELRRPAPHE